jgi:hypothetical protein
MSMFLKTAAMLIAPQLFAKEAVANYLLKRMKGQPLDGEAAQPGPHAPAGGADTIELMDRKSNFVDVFSKHWHGADFSDEIALAGISNVRGVNAAADESRLTIEMASGSRFVWVREEAKGNGLSDKPSHEFIGLARGMNKAADVTTQQADEIAGLAAARGWKVINVHGSDANKETLWLAARKIGLEVEGFTPKPETVKALAAWQAKNPAKVAAPDVVITPAPAPQKLLPAPKM